MSKYFFARINQKHATHRQRIPESRGEAQDILNQFGRHNNFPHLYQPQGHANWDMAQPTQKDQYQWHKRWLRCAWGFIDMSASQMEKWYQMLSLSIPSDAVTSAESDEQIQGSYRGSPGKALGNLALRSIAQTALVAPSTLLAGAAGGAIGGFTGPAGAVTAGTVSAIAAAQASKQSYKNLEKLAGKKYGFNTTLKSLYPSVRRTDAALSSQLMQFKVSEDSSDSLMANRALGTANKAIRNVSPTAKIVMNFVPFSSLAGMGYEYCKLKKGLSNEKLERMGAFLDELESVLQEQLATAKSHLLALDSGMDESLGVSMSTAHQFQTRIFDWKSEKESRITLSGIQKKYMDAQNLIRRNRALLEIISTQGMGPFRDHAVSHAIPED